MTHTPREAAPLSDVMLAMDVVDTLRHQEDLVARAMSAEERQAALIERLRTLYRDQGIAVPDHILLEGVRALEESRFAYAPAPDSLSRRLALIYVGRLQWGRPVLVVLTALILLVAGYFLIYRPYVAMQEEGLRVELAETLPARMDALFEQIYVETKVQSALERARPIVARGKAAAGRGDREEALRAISQLEAIHNMLLAEFSLRIVNRAGEDTGVWRFPSDRSDATNYYIVVEAIGPEGNALTLPIENEETGRVEMVDIWAVRVPEVTYESVRADRLDDGIIQRNIMGIKQYGFLDIEYVMPVLDGAITEW